MSEHPLANYPRPPPRGEDLPYDDGEPMESSRHVEQMVLLIQTLRDNWSHPSDFFVGGNMFVYFSETQAKKNDFRGPDVFVVVGRPGRHRKSWVAWEEDGRLPDVVIELLSPTTERVDREEKMRIYRDVMHVRRYFLFDPFTKVFEGYALDDRGDYVPLELDEDGCLECTPLGLRLGVRETDNAGERWRMLRWIDETGEILPTGVELAASTAARADAEVARANAETARADAEAARADAEAARADAETVRADALARRLAELEGRGED